MILGYVRYDKEEKQRLHDGEAQSNTLIGWKMKKKKFLMVWAGIRVTHNLRVQYNKEEKTCYILEAKPSNPKINISAQTYITIVGIGSSIDNISYGIKFSCST